MRFLLASGAAALLFLPLASVPATAEDSEDEPAVLEIFGWVERVKLMDGTVAVKTRLDTGAVTSSLHAVDIERFERDDERWVRFTVVDPESEETLEVEKRLVRNVRIVQHDGEHQRRPVVEMQVCLGDIPMEVEVNLVDRSNFNYPMLLGRSALKGIALVDSGATFTTSPQCDTESKGS
jgi:hypothetical protein